MIFTIAIPTYNNADSIEKTIQSCINQNYSDVYEILVVNNNCTDNTSQILEKYSKSLTIYKNETTVTMWENHNICLSKAKGDYVVFCHADDILLPDALKKYQSIIKKRDYPERYVLWGRSMYRDFYYNWSSGGFSLNQIASGQTAINAFQHGGLTPSGTCYSRKEFINEKGFISTNHKLAPSDLVTMWKLVLNHFEFEMIDRLCFIREFASTASGPDFNPHSILDSLKDAICCLKLNLNKNQQSALVNLISTSSFYDPIVLEALVSAKMVPSIILRKKTAKYILKYPFQIRKRRVLRILLGRHHKNGVK